MKSLFITPLSVFLLFGCASIRTHREGKMTAFVGALVIEPATNGPPRSIDLLIRGDEIIASGSILKLPQGTHIVDARCKFTMPGLWDAHSHFNALTEVTDERDLGYGVLFVRGAGAYLEKLLSLRASAQSGEHLGPDMSVAGPTLNGLQAGQFQRVVSNAKDARATVREPSAVGIGNIKTHRRTSREACFAMIDSHGF